MLDLRKDSDDESGKGKNKDLKHEDDSPSGFKGNKSPLKKETKELNKSNVKVVKGEDLPKEKEKKKEKREEPKFKDEYAKEAYKIRVEDLTEIIISLEVQIKELTSRVSKSNNEEMTKKIKELEEKLVTEKEDILQHNKQVQRFMEVGNKTIVNQREQIETAAEALEQIKEELIRQEHLLQKREELVEKAHKDVEEAQEAHNSTKLKNVELEHTIEKILTSMNRLQEEKRQVEHENIECRNKVDKIEKHNLLVEELNKEMLDLNIEDLCQFINQSMYECLHSIKSSLVKEVIKNSTNITEKLKSMGMVDALEAMDGIIGKDERKKSLDKEKSDDDEKSDDEDDDKEYFKERLEYAKEHNPLLRKLLNLKEYKIKGKDGKWRDRITFETLFSKIKKGAKESKNMLSKALNTDKKRDVKSKKEADKKVVKKGPNVQEENRELRKANRALTRENKKLARENKKLLEKQERYEQLFSKVMHKIFEDIQEVTDSYKGIVDFSTDKLMNKFKESKTDKKKEENDEDIIKRIKKQNMELLKDVSNAKLLYNEVVVDNQKYIKKEKELKNNITELKISYDDIQQRFESRISEYKQQLHLKDEKINSLYDHIRFQKKVVVDQDQKLSLMSSKLDAEKAKLKDAKQYQELQNVKLREFNTHVSELNKQIEEIMQERKDLKHEVQEQTSVAEKLKVKMKTLEEIYYKSDQKLMKENAKFLKLTDKYKDMEGKLEEAKEMIEKEKADKQALQMKFANVSRGGESVPRARGAPKGQRPPSDGLGDVSEQHDNDSEEEGEESDEGNAKSDSEHDGKK